MISLQKNKIIFNPIMLSLPLGNSISILVHSLSMIFFYMFEVMLFVLFSPYFFPHLRLYNKHLVMSLSSFMNNT